MKNITFITIIAIVFLMSVFCSLVLIEINFAAANVMFLIALVDVLIGAIDVSIKSK